MSIDIKHLEKLANLKLANKEKQKIGKQLEETISFIEKLDKINTNNIQETNQVTEVENVLREDETMPSLSQEEALKNSRQTHNGLFKVKAILNE